MTLYQSYKENGGSIQDVNSFNSIAGSTIASFADAIEPANQYGRQSIGTNIAKSAGSLAAAGSAFGPIGTGVGAAVGIGMGVIKGIQQQKEERRLKFGQANAIRQAQLSQYAAKAAQDPNSITGNKGENYFEGGGHLFAEYSKYKAQGGSLSRLSSDSVAVNGPSHANGGVKLNTGDEVEGGETIKGDYVFSKKLGFAQLHKPLAKVIHKLEERPVTKTSLGSLSRLRKREDALMLLQEMVRKQNHLG
jgi:hypothetical protein